MFVFIYFYYKNMLYNLFTAEKLFSYSTNTATRVEN